MAETWRVVLASGESHEVDVRELTHGVERLGWTANGITGESPFAALTQWAARSGLSVRETLAPGEATRAELMSQRDEAIAVAERLRSAESYFTDRDRNAARREGAEAMREACAAACERIATLAPTAVVLDLSAQRRLDALRRGASTCAEVIAALPLDSEPDPVG